MLSVEGVDLDGQERDGFSHEPDVVSRVLIEHDGVPANLGKTLGYLDALSFDPVPERIDSLSEPLDRRCRVDVHDPIVASSSVDRSDAYASCANNPTA
jgi:hypothetical protein